jgi:hypothetical protein
MFLKDNTYRVFNVSLPIYHIIVLYSNKCNLWGYCISQVTSGFSPVADPCWNP